MVDSLVDKTHLFNEDGSYRLWSDIYAEMYSDVNLYGISWTEYWDMQPIEVLRVAEKHRAKLVDDTNYELTMAWYKASLIGIASNDPKKFPKKPAKLNTEQDNVEQMRMMAKQFQVIKDRAQRDGGGY